jgi:uncharacterized protein (TIGR00730 family)
MNICVYGAASDNIKQEFKTQGELLGQKMAERGHGLVFGGGAAGLMGATARGVHSKGGKMLAVVPSFFNVDGVLFPYSTETVYTDTMRERKRILEESADAFIMSPGGIGTFDEFFEIITLYSLKRHKKPIAIFNTLGYYDAMINMLKMGVAEGFIGEHVLDICFVSSDADEVLDFLEKNA